MTIERMDHVGVVVNDLEAGVAFFVELGLELQARWTVEGEWVDRIIALEGARSESVMLRTPDGRSQIELSSFESPPSPPAEHEPTNAVGIRHLSFAVDDLDAAVERVRAGGYALVGEIVRYEDRYRLCYVRGPDGIIVELAEELR